MKSLTTTIAYLSTLALAIAIVSVVFIVPTVQDVRTMRQDIAVEQAQLEARYAQGLLLKRLHTDGETIRGEADTIDRAMLTTKNSIAFITGLESLTEAQGITHQLTLPLSSETRTRTPSSTIPFTLQWRGDWTALLQSLVALEHEPYYLPIETIRIVAEHGARLFPSGQSLPAPSLANAPIKKTPTSTMTLEGFSIWYNE